MFIYLATRARFARSMLFVTVIWAMIVSSLAMPASALAQGTSNLANEVTKPWFKSDMDWDANWGAFNTKQSEKVAGACALNSRQAEGLKELISALRSDWDHIQSDKKLRKNAESTFRRYYERRLAENKPYDDAADEVKLHNAQAKIKKAAPVSKVEGFEDFYFKVNSDPDLAGCDQSDALWKNIVKTLTPNPIEIFKNPGGFFVRVLIYIICWPVIPIYAVMSPVALGLTLTTPHSERGDTLVNTWKVFSSTSSKSTNSDNVCQYSKKNAGFNCDNLQQDKQNSNAWLKVASSLRSALSAFYGIIIIGAAMIYMFRRAPGAAYDVKVLLPRVFAAVMLGAAAPFLIGALISMSNFMVQGVLSGGGNPNIATGDLNSLGGGAGAVPNQVNQAIWATSQSTGGVAGFAGSLLASVLPAFLIICFAVGYVMLALIAIVKQVVLIALIVATPVACLALVNRKWEHVFSFWVRGLGAVILLPVAQALILAIGLALAGAFFDPTGGSKNFVGRLLAAFVLLVTIRMMVKVANHARAYVTGAQVQSGTARAGLAKLGGLAAGGAAAALGQPAVGAKLYQAGNTIGDGLKERAGRGGGFIPKTSGGGMLAPAASRGMQNTLSSQALGKVTKEMGKPGATVGLPGLGRKRQLAPGEAVEKAMEDKMAKDQTKQTLEQVRKQKIQGELDKKLTEKLRKSGELEPNQVIRRGRVVTLRESSKSTPEPADTPPTPAPAPSSGSTAGDSGGASVTGPRAGGSSATAASGRGQARSAGSRPASTGGGPNLAPNSGHGPAAPPTSAGPAQAKAAPKAGGETVSPGGVILPSSTGRSTSRVNTPGDRTRGAAKNPGANGGGQPKPPPARGA